MRKLVAALFVVAAIVSLLVVIPLATAQGEIAGAAAEEPAASTWRILLIVFQETDTDYVGLDGQWHHMTTSLTDSEIGAMLTSFTGPVAAAVREWSAGAVQWDIDVRYASRPVTRLSSPDPSSNRQWLDPMSIQDVIDGYSPDGVYDQVMVYWSNGDGSAVIPSWGWGLALPYFPSQAWGYLTVTAIRASYWNPSVADIWSQIWIHEWLHCACSFYASQGHPMPVGDADGWSYHGYAEGQDGLPGWAAYYSDLMQGRVLEGNQRFGITREAWLSGSIRTATTTSSTTSTTLIPAEHFSDVSSSPYKTAIESLAQAGVINGYQDRTFRPLNPVLRAQFAKIIVGGLGLSVTDGAISCPFSDVPKGPSSDPLYPDDYVATAALNGLVEGYGGGLFKPYIDITRAQLLTIVVRAAQNLKPSAIQEPSAGWQGVLPGDDVTHGKNIARAEYSGLLAGINLPAFSIWGKASRGEIAQIIWNLREE